MSRKALIAAGVLGLAGFSAEVSAQAVGGASAAIPAVPAPAIAAPAVPAPAIGGVTIPGATVGGVAVSPTAVAPGAALPGVATGVGPGGVVTTSVGGVIVGPSGVAGTAVGSSAPIVWGAPAGSQSGPIHPYSYYIEFPNPARTYVPYGPSDTFTYQGQAYGHAYDRWTWAAMSNASPGLGRYYQLLH